MFSKLPNEIIYSISKLVAQDSTLCLKPLVLVNRRWHGVAVPLLLATISVSSLGQVVELCSQIISSHRHEDNHVSSRIAKYTRTIVISGVKWEEGMADCQIGLEQPELQDRAQDDHDTEDDWPPSALAAAKPDTDMSPKDISDMIQSALPYLVLLDGFEWYGRFAGDYCLVKYLQRANVIRYLAYGIEWHVSGSSPGYYNNAFLFTGLKSVAITCDSVPTDKLFARMSQMMRQNPELQSILYDCQEHGASITSVGTCSLEDLICDPSLSSADKSIVIWPNLQHLVLQFCQDSLWMSAQGVDQLARFLVAHPKLETLFLYEICTPSCQIDTAQPLSLSSHPDALPHLKKILGSRRLIAGILESHAACLSVQTVVDTEDSWVHDKQANHKTPYIERIICALEKAPENQIHRLSLEIPQLSSSLFARLARFAPNVRFLELMDDQVGSKLWATSLGDAFDAAVDIPAGLNKFPKLETIGQDIATAFIDPFDDKRSGLLELARKTPRLKYIHCGDGARVTYVRGPCSELDIRVSSNSPNNEDYDWLPYKVDWGHRPMSCRAMQEAWVSEMGAEMGATEFELSWFF